MKKKKKGIGILPFLILLIGIGIMLYPTASNYYNVIHQSSAIVEYAKNLAAMDNEATRRLWDEAVAYNRDLYRAQCGEDLPKDALKNYDDILRVADNGMMGYIDIAKIGVHLPIYHGTTEPVLQKGIGHLEWSSFPTGGENTHTVLTGHTGLPSARLFTDLDQMQVGDRFVLNIAGEIMTYEIEDIHTVAPHEIGTLSIASGQDLCTLVTCTPYGVNSHRLLLRAHRVENEVEEEAPAEVKVEANAFLPMLGAALAAFGCLLLFLVIRFWDGGQKKKKAPTTPAPRGKARGTNKNGNKW